MECHPPSDDEYDERSKKRITWLRRWSGTQHDHWRSSVWNEQLGPKVDGLLIEYPPEASRLHNLKTRPQIRIQASKLCVVWLSEVPTSDYPSPSSRFWCYTVRAIIVLGCNHKNTRFQRLMNIWMNSIETAGDVKCCCIAALSDEQSDDPMHTTPSEEQCAL